MPSNNKYARTDEVYQPDSFIKLLNKVILAISFLCVWQSSLANNTNLLMGGWSGQENEASSKIEVYIWKDSVKSPLNLAMFSEGNQCGGLYNHESEINNTNIFERDDEIIPSKDKANKNNVCVNHHSISIITKNEETDLRIVDADGNTLLTSKINKTNLSSTLTQYINEIMFIKIHSASLPNAHPAYPVSRRSSRREMANKDKTPRKLKKPIAYTLDDKGNKVIQEDFYEKQVAKSNQEFAEMAQKSTEGFIIEKKDPEQKKKEQWAAWEKEQTIKNQRRLELREKHLKEHQALVKKINNSTPSECRKLAVKGRVVKCDVQIDDCTMFGQCNFSTDCGGPLYIVGQCQRILSLISTRGGVQYCDTGNVNYISDNLDYVLNQLCNKKLGTEHN